jgi:hypothetical protein
VLLNILVAPLLVLVLVLVLVLLYALSLLSSLLLSLLLSSLLFGWLHRVGLVQYMRHQHAMASCPPCLMSPAMQGISGVICIVACACAQLHAGRCNFKSEHVESIGVWVWIWVCVVTLPALAQGDEFVITKRETPITKRALHGEWWNSDYAVKKVVFAVKPDGTRKAR